jgi:heme oxygenase
MAIVNGAKRGRPGKWLADYRDGAGVRHWRTFNTKREARSSSTASGPWRGSS